jgi:hypothetical protein
MYKKLSKIQAALKVPKNQYNKFGEYYYRNAEDILEALKPLLIEHELTLTLTDEIALIGDRYYVKATAILTDGTNKIETSAFAREPETPKAKTDMSQQTGGCSTYARKYALNGLFCIDDTKDADTTNKGENDSEKTFNELANSNSASENAATPDKCPKCKRKITDGAFQKWGMCVNCKQKEKVA